MTYVVTRQHYWHEPDEPYAVEISKPDYWGPDALASNFADDFYTSEDPREVAEAAIRLRSEWYVAAKPEHVPRFTFSFNDLVYPTTADGISASELRRWARKRYEDLPKCDQCGSLLPDEHYVHFELGSDDEKFCSSYCAELRWYALYGEEAEDDA